MTYHHISNEQLRELMASTPDLQVVDVRTPEEFEQHGHVPGAHNLPVQTINQWATTLKLDAPIAFLCKGGVRSVYACDYMTDTQHWNPDVPLYNLEYGMTAWDGELAYRA
jgi:rhodanese-related sulfurtransferase